MKNIILSLSLIAFAYSDDHTIAVLDFSGENIHQDELVKLSAAFRTELLKMDTLLVLDYDDMSESLIKYGYNSPSCTSIECAVITSMLLDQEWLISVHVSKVGDVFLMEGRLLESKTGRVINAVNYDFELTIEGLYTRGMHNLSDLIMSKRIPLEVHKRQNLIYFKTKPPAAMVLVGKDTLNGTTPLAIDRVVVESRPITLFKQDYQPFQVKQLPNDDSDIIYVELKLEIPQVGNVVFNQPIPDDISIVSSDGKNSLLINKGDKIFKNLPVGSYRLDSDLYVIRNNKFRIQHRRTTKLSPIFYTTKEINDRKKYYLSRRLLYLQIMGGGVLYRSFITARSSYLYNQYSSNIDQGNERHRKIENLDKQKPVFDVLSGIMVFPIIYYHAKYLEMERWLKN